MKNKSVIYFGFLFIGYVNAVLLCATTEDCDVIPNSECINPEGTCYCVNGYFMQSNYCYESKYEYGASCEIDKQCEWIGSNGGCFEGVCACSPNFWWFKGVCTQYTGLGGTCNDTVTCFDGYNPLALECKDEKCVCPNGYQNRGDFDCRLIAESLNDSCALDFDCKHGKCLKGICAEEEPTSTLSLGLLNESGNENFDDFNTFTNSIDIICPQGFFLEDGVCVGEIGIQNCTTDSNCTIKPGKCVDGHCYCRDYYITKTGNQECVKPMIQTNWNCLSDEWCYTLGGSGECNTSQKCQCSSDSKFNSTYNFCEIDDSIPKCNPKCQNNMQCINNTCACGENSVLSEDRTKCIYYIGEACDKDEYCPEKSECRGGISKKCECVGGFVKSESKTICLKESRMNEACIEDAQCGIQFTKCNKTCKCQNNYTQYEDKCYYPVGYNSFCNNLLECQIFLGDEVQCRKSRCQCPTWEKFENGNCVSNATIIIVYDIFYFFLGIMCYHFISVYLFYIEY